MFSQNTGGKTNKMMPQKECVHLTDREMAVLKCAREGQSSKEIADALYVCKRTVDFHLGNIYDKLEVRNRVRALRRAAALGLLPPEETQSA
jgi:DNA-binding NarL/FixJ family response regulator